MRLSACYSGGNMKRQTILTIGCLIIVILFLTLAVNPRPGFPIHIPTHIAFYIACLAILFIIAAAVIHALEPGRHRPGFTGPGTAPPPPIQPGFTGPMRTITAAQALSLEHRTPVILSGNLIQSIGADLYTFRDTSGEITVRIGPMEWQSLGVNINPSDTIEISGELHREQEGFQRTPEIHARQIRKV
jgi:uncharacterized protein (TIGR00156 family)